MHIDCTTLYVPFLCRELGYIPTPFVQSITCVKDGKPIAGVVYDNYNTVSIAAHIWIAHGAVPSRQWYAAIFDYPFNRLQVSKIIGQVVEGNPEAVRLDSHFGFVEEGRIKDHSPDGDLILYTMTKAQCRVLNSPRWKKVADIVRVA